MRPPSPADSLEHPCSVERLSYRADGPGKPPLDPSLDQPAVCLPDPGGSIAAAVRYLERAYREAGLPELGPTSRTAGRSRSNAVGDRIAKFVDSSQVLRIKMTRFTSRLPGIRTACRRPTSIGSDLKVAFPVEFHCRIRLQPVPAADRRPGGGARLDEQPE